MKLFVRFAKTYEKMHVIELQSLLEQRNESTEIIHMGKNELFCIIEVDDIETVDFILERAIFVKSVSFCDYLYFDNFANCHNIDRNEITVRLKITTIETQMKTEKRNEIIQRNIQYIGNNSISLTSPDYVYQIYVSNDEEYNTIHYKDSKRKEYLKYDVKYRPFIGITCMDWEISIFMANLCGVNDQSLVLEPFIGSAGIAMACLLFNAHIVGIEYDLKMLYGQKERKGNVKTSIKGSKIHDNFEFINKANNVVSVINANSFTVNLDCEFDAIITDPPYGDRISLSRKKPVDYIQCLKRLADNNLKRNGKLCFFFPIEYDQKTVEILNEYKLVVSIRQVLRSVTRILYVFEKTK